MYKRNFNGADIFGAIIILGCVVFVGVAIWWFPQADCNTARRGLTFIEQCTADPDCMMTAREANLKKVYTQLEIKSCSRD